MNQPAIDKFLERNREEREARDRTWQQKWALKSNREKAQYLLGLTDVTARVSEHDARVLQAAQVYATLAVVDATEAQGKGLV